MALEINEIGIRMRVRDRKNRNPDEEEDEEEQDEKGDEDCCGLDHAQVVEDCVRRVLKILKTRQER